MLFPLILAACQEDPEPIPVNRNLQSPAIHTGEALAQALSVQVERKVVRDYLKSELLRKFDGDYNLLIALHREEFAKGEQSSEGILKGSSDGPMLDALLETYPLLQVAMPSLSGKTAEDWNTEDQIPLVVFRPVDADLNEMSTLTAYRNGKPTELDLTQEPDDLILVISNNERTVVVPEGERPGKAMPFAIDQSCADQIASVGSYNTLFYYLISELENCDGGGGGNGTIQEGCDRDRSSARDRISRAKFTTMNYMREAEHYLDGNPELYFVVTLASKNPSGFASLRKSYPSKDRSQWKDCGIFSCVPEWYNHDQPVFNWDPDVFGNLVRYDWFEEDFSTSKIDITLGLTSKFETVSVSGNVKISISKKDYFLDQDFVNYCDQTTGRGTDYNTGKLYFTINNP